MCAARKLNEQEIMEARKKVGIVLQDLVDQMLLNKPEDPVPYVLEILERMSGIGKTPLSKQENVELSRLREEYKQLKTKNKNMKKDK